jgi:hypothetical protein
MRSSRWARNSRVVKRERCGCDSNWQNCGSRGVNPERTQSAIDDEERTAIIGLAKGEKEQINWNVIDALILEFQSTQAVSAPAHTVKRCLLEENFYRTLLRPWSTELTVWSKKALDNSGSLLKTQALMAAISTPTFQSFWSHFAKNFRIISRSWWE